MDRRKFFSVAGAGAAGVAAAIPGAAAPKHKAVAGGACASAELPPLKARLGHQITAT